MSSDPCLINSIDSSKFVNIINKNNKEKINDKNIDNLNIDLINAENVFNNESNIKKIINKNENSVDLNLNINGVFNETSFVFNNNNINKDNNNNCSDDEINKYDINNKNDDKCGVVQNCRKQKRLFSSLGRRDPDRLKVKTGFRSATRSCRFRGEILSMLHVLVAVIIYHLLMIERVSGGICWASMQRNGRCKELTGEKMTKEECCAAGQNPGTAWSSEDLDSGTLFFWRILGGGVPCNVCRETCNGVQCGPGRRCAIRRGRPRCVCAPRCGGGRAGPVCGTDGRSYRSLCRLRKRACRRRARDLTLDYYGHCQDSCAKIRCGSGRHCLLDQDSRAHCVKCTRSCPRIPLADHDSKPLCGADGVTYSSTCHLQAAACRKGKSIPLAYRSACDPNATCDTVRCRSRQECLMDWRTNTPRCVTCSARCPRAKRTLCASNNRTYSSWCHMLKDACITGFVLETKHAGTCGADDLNDFNLVFNADDDDGEKLDVF